MTYYRIRSSDGSERSLVTTTTSPAGGTTTISLGAPIENAWAGVNKSANLAGDTVYGVNCLITNTSSVKLTAWKLSGGASATASGTQTTIQVMAEVDHKA